MISLDNLTVSYGGWTLFDGISFLINEKDRIGLVGRNGAGKTTLLRIITGEQQPTEGAVTINGECTIGYLPQQMRVADTTTLKAETEKAFDEVLRLEADMASLTEKIATRTDYESEEYAELLHRLNEVQDRYHILGGDTREADIEKTLLGLGCKRSALTHSRVMIHQPLGGVQGQASDIEITAREILKLKKELYTIISDHSKQPFDKVWADSDRDYWMTAAEAQEYGMIDRVLARKK